MNGPRALLATLGAGLLGILVVSVTLFVRVRHDEGSAARKPPAPAAAPGSLANGRIGELEDRIEDLERELAVLQREIAERRAVVARGGGAGGASVAGGAKAAGPEGGGGPGDAEELAALFSQTAGEEGSAAEELRGALSDLLQLPAQGKGQGDGGDPKDAAGAGQRMDEVADRVQEVLTLSPYQREVFLESNAKAREIRGRARDLLFDPGATLQQKREAARALRQSRYAAKRSFLKTLDGEQRRTLLQLEKEHLLPKGWLLPSGMAGGKGKKKKHKS